MHYILYSFSDSCNARFCCGEIVLNSVEVSDWHSVTQCDTDYRVSVRFLGVVTWPRPVRSVEVRDCLGVSLTNCLRQAAADDSQQPAEPAEGNQGPRRDVCRPRGSRQEPAHRPHPRHVGEALVPVAETSRQLHHRLPRTTQLPPGTRCSLAISRHVITSWPN